MRRGHVLTTPDVAVLLTPFFWLYMQYLSDKVSSYGILNGGSVLQTLPPAFLHTLLNGTHQ